MDTQTLVSVDIDRGAEIIETLDRAKVKVAVALWAFLSEYEDWRLVMASRQFDSPDPRSAYRLLHESIASADTSFRKTPAVLILQTTDPFIRELRRLFGKAKSVKGMRLGGQTLGDRFIQDAYVYRIS